MTANTYFLEETSEKTNQTGSYNPESCQVFNSRLCHTAMETDRNSVFGAVTKQSRESLVIFAWLDSTYVLYFMHTESAEHVAEGFLSTQSLVSN